MTTNVTLIAPRCCTYDPCCPPSETIRDERPDPSVLLELVLGKPLQSWPINVDGNIRASGGLLQQPIISRGTFNAISSYLAILQQETISRAPLVVQAPITFSSEVGTAKR
jgi:hypothetical protein